jgi:hypothetical protein
MKLVSNGQAMAPVQEKLGTAPEIIAILCHFHGENDDSPVGLNGLFSD